VGKTGYNITTYITFLQLSCLLILSVISNKDCCLSSLCWTIILAVWWSDSKKMAQNYDVPVKTGISETEPSHSSHWTQCTVNWSVTCFWYCRRTAEDTLLRQCFWFLLTYLVTSHTILTYMSKQNTAKSVTETKTKIQPKLNDNENVSIKLKRYLKLKNTGINIST